MFGCSINNEDTVDLILLGGRCWREVGWSPRTSAGLWWPQLTSSGQQPDQWPRYIQSAGLTAECKHQHISPLSPVCSQPSIAMSDVESLQPWQIFCSMFAVFWLFSACLNLIRSISASIAILSRMDGVPGTDPGLLCNQELR